MPVYEAGYPAPAEAGMIGALAPFSIPASKEGGMRDPVVILLLAFLLAAGCWRPAVSPGPPPAGPVTAWPADWAAVEGRRAVLEGEAGDAKLGTMLVGQNGAVWIDGLDAWPEGVAGKRVRVEGTVAGRDDLPLAEAQPSSPPRAGVSGSGKRRWL